MSRRTRFAAVASHPIPYYVTLYQALAEHGGIDVRAFFASKIGIKATFDPHMGVPIRWETDLLAGYESVFLPGADRIEGTSFRDVNNPGTWRALSDFAPDVVLIHGYSQITMLRALTWCTARRVPALMISDSSLHSGTTKLQKLAKRLVLPHVFKRFSAFLCVGDANEKYLKEFGAPYTAIFRTPHIIDQMFWKNRERRSDVRAETRAALGLKENDLAVLFVGKLIERKRPGDIVAALAALRSMPPTARPVKAFFAGNGVQRAALERQAAEAGLPAHFLGFVNIDALPKYYCAADALAHPAEIETFGVIVLEAAILGLPLVLSERVGAVGATSIARPGENALIHACGDVDGLARALHRLASEPATLQRMADASLRISRELDWRKSVAGGLAAIEYCLQSRGHPPLAVEDSRSFSDPSHASG